MVLESGVIGCVGFVCVLNVSVAGVRGVFMVNVWFNVFQGNGRYARRVASLNKQLNGGMI